jgi:beta-aspartyl-peptidase (threonine type)
MDKPSKRQARPALLVHGGAWATPKGEREDHLKGVHRASMVGFEVLLTGGSALEAVQKAVEFLEADPAFNAGKGSVLDANGDVRLDAAIMEGSNLRAGAVANVTSVLHPVALARAVMEQSKHVLLVSEGALAFARERGIATCSPAELIVDRERERFERAKRLAAETPGDTVGAVACDASGHVAAATSTGGSLMKRPGRVGDSPIIGAGLYADDRRGAASSTGWGEGIQRVVMAHRAVEMMAAVGPAEAAQQAIEVLASRTDGKGGIILVDPKGELGYAFNTPHMAYAYLAGSMTKPEVGI